MTNPSYDVDDETLARWRRDPKSIPDDQQDVARYYGWRGTVAGWAPPFGPVPPPEPVDVANQNVIEFELKKLGLDIDGASWVIAPTDGFTRIAFDLDAEMRPVPLGGAAPWDRFVTRCIIKLTRSEVSNADSQYTCYIEVWNRGNRRLLKVGDSVLPYEGPEFEGLGIDKDKYYWFQTEAVAENPYQAVRRSLTELLGDDFTFGSFDAERYAEVMGLPREEGPTSAEPPPNDVDGEPELSPEEKRAYYEQHVNEMIETAESDAPPEESWSDTDIPAVDESAARSFFSSRWLVAGGIAVVVAGALLAAMLLGGGGDSAEDVPASAGSASTEVTGGQSTAAAAPVADDAVPADLLGDFVWYGDGVINFSVEGDRIIGRVATPGTHSTLNFLVGINVICPEFVSDVVFDLDLTGSGEWFWYKNLPCERLGGAEVTVEFVATGATARGQQPSNHPDFDGNPQGHTMLRVRN